MTTIETGVPVPEPKKPVRRRGGAKKAAAPSAADGLIKALQFASLAQKSQGTAYQMHCLINNHWLVAFDGTLTIGCKVEEDISACPHSATLLAALSKCGAQVAISQLNEHVLTIRSEKFRASIECVSYESMPITAPDSPDYPIDDTIREALTGLAWLPVEGSLDAWRGAVLLQNGSAVATNGHVLLEHWHGQTLPGAILIPKAAIVALSKIDKKLKAFGCSNVSATFYFEDDSFMRTLIFNDRFPQYEGIFKQSEGLSVLPLPPDFYEAVNAVCGFAESKFVYFLGDKLTSHKEAERGAVYDIAGIPDKMAFDSGYLKQVEPHFKNTCFAQDKVFFSNGSVRGALTGGSHFKS